MITLVFVYIMGWVFWPVLYVHTYEFWGYEPPTDMGEEGRVFFFLAIVFWPVVMPILLMYELLMKFFEEYAERYR